MGEVVLLGEFGVTTRDRIRVGDWLGRDVESAEYVPSTDGRRGVEESMEGRLIFSPEVGVVGVCRDVGDLARVGEEGSVGEGESGR